MLCARRSPRSLGLEKAVRPALSEPLEPRRLLAGVSWTQLAKLRASDGATFDFLGDDVAISGDIGLVGSFWDDDNGTNSPDRSPLQSRNRLADCQD
jgi:hypothetical protein